MINSWSFLTPSENDPVCLKRKGLQVRIAYVQYSTLTLKDECERTIFFSDSVGIAW